jgi:hypothetical protein
MHPGFGLTSVPRGVWTPGFCGSSAHCWSFARVRGLGWVRQGYRVRPWRGEIQVGRLLLLAAAVTVAPFLIRLVPPFDPSG